MAKKITPSTGNVFEDLGFPKEEAENLRVRSALMATIRTILEEEGLTQARAANLFGVTQPRVRQPRPRKDRTLQHRRPSEHGGRKWSTRRYLHRDT